MTFALFLGAGNIIFPPGAGLSAGTNMGLVSLGFLLTGVGLPLMTIVALARVGGGLSVLSSPMGKRASTLFAVIIYLAIGPFFATPRTAVVSFEVGMAPFVGGSHTALFIYSASFFIVALALSLNPGRLVDSVGKVITPILLAALLVMGITAVLSPSGSVGEPSAGYQTAPFVKGFLQGYLTMDTLGALVFGIVIANAITNKGVTDKKLITKYSIIAGLIAAIGLSAVYLSFFYLGAISHDIAANAKNGGQVLTAYAQSMFGFYGQILLSIVITLACLTTAIGLLSACGEYFQQRFSIPYKLTVVVFACFSFLASNQGLTQLISFSIPVLTSLYPLAIVLVSLNLLNKFWISPPRIFIPVMLVTLFFSIIDSISATRFSDLLPSFLNYLPLTDHSLSWIVPALITLVIVVVIDRSKGKGQVIPV
ncbi:UNVERIFIED_CONTAM: hypothetical protein GTU68_008587 [Idotea baltica]|nr:hypothetical protein [Idotea baltica]